MFGEAEAKFGSSNTPQCLVNAASGKNAGTAIEWVEGGLLKSFPMVSMVWRGGRYGPVVTDYRSEPIAEWIAGSRPLLDRASAITETPKEELFNEFVLRYGYDPVLDVFEKTMIRGAENSSLCEYSRQLIEERHAEVIESLYITDDALASYVLDWCVAHLSLPSHYVEYEVMPRVFIEHNVGDTIWFTDTEQGWSREKATIERMTKRRGHLLVGIRVWDRISDIGGGAYSVQAVGE
jgi:hypothetical protein